MENRNYYILGVIILLLTGSLLMTCTETSNERRENRELKQEYKKIEKEKATLQADFNNLKKDYAQLKEADSVLQTTIVKVEKVNTKLKKDLNKAKSDLNAYREVIPYTIGDSLCDKVIAEYDTLLAGKEHEIILKDSLIDFKDDRITNLETQVANRELAYVMSNQQLLIQNDIISNKNKQIRKLQTRNIILGTTGGAIAVGLIMGLIFIK